MKKICLLLFLFSAFLLANPKVIVQIEGDISEEFLDGIKIGVISSNYSLFDNFNNDKEENDKNNDKNEEEEENEYDKFLDIAQKNNIKVIINIKVENKKFNVKIINFNKQENLLYYVNNVNYIKEENFIYNAEYSEGGKLTIFAKKLIQSILKKKTPKIIIKTIIKKETCIQDKLNSRDNNIDQKEINLKIGINSGLLRQYYVDPYVISGNSLFFGLTFNLDYNINSMVSFFTELSFNKTLVNYYRSETNQKISLNMINLKVGTSISLKDYFIRLSLGREFMILEHMNITSFNYGMELGKEIYIQNYNLDFYAGISYGYYDHSVIIYNDHTRDIRDTGYEVPIYLGVRYSFY